ncbi:MAG: FliH/SctL family protein [candidate division Zixibacteria bacterium]
MFNRVIKDVDVENSKIIPNIRKSRRIIPAEDVIIEKAIRINTAAPHIEQVVDTPAQSVKDRGTNPESVPLSELSPGESARINMLVEQKVREFEQRFQDEKEAAFKEGFDQGQKRGFQDGTARISGLEKLLDSINSTIKSQRDDILGESEKVISKLVIEIAEAVIGEAVMKSSKELLDFNLKRCLEVLGGSGKVKVRISPSDYAFAEAELLGELRRDTEQFDFQLEPDPAISPGGCYIETEGGAIDARVESQFEQIKNSFLQLV